MRERVLNEKSVGRLRSAAPKKKKTLCGVLDFRDVRCRVVVCFVFSIRFCGFVVFATTCFLWRVSWDRFAVVFVVTCSCTATDESTTATRKRQHCACCFAAFESRDFIDLFSKRLRASDHPTQNPQMSSDKAVSFSQHRQSRSLLSRHTLIARSKSQFDQRLPFFCSRFLFCHTNQRSMADTVRDESPTLHRRSDAVYVRGSYQVSPECSLVGSPFGIQSIIPLMKLTSRGSPPLSLDESSSMPPSASVAGFREAMSPVFSHCGEASNPLTPMANGPTVLESSLRVYTGSMSVSGDCHSTCSSLATTLGPSVVPIAHRTPV